MLFEFDLYQAFLLSISYNDNNIKAILNQYEEHG